MCYIQRFYRHFNDAQFFRSNVPVAQDYANLHLRHIGYKLNITKSRTIFKHSLHINLATSIEKYEGIKIIYFH